MTVSCPNCGAEIVAVVIGSAPLPGWRNPGATGANGSAQVVAQTPVAHGSEVQDLEPSPKTERAYNQGYSRNFEEFWQVYPLHRDKRKAYKAWRNSVARLGATPDARAAIIAGAIRYRDDPNRLKEFTKYAEGWLNGDGWEDEPLPARISTRRPPDPPRPMTSGEMDRAIEEALRD